MGIIRLHPRRASLAALNTTPFLHGKIISLQPRRTLPGTAAPPYAHGNALHFDGSNDRVDFTATTFLNGASAFTAAWWQKDDVLQTTRRVINKCNGGASLGMQIAVGQNAGKTVLYVVVANGSIAYGEWIAPSNFSGAWHHYGVVYLGTESTNATRLKLYVDGVQITFTGFTGTIPATVGALGLPMRLGTRADALVEFYDGWLDEIVFWPTANADYVTAHYNGGAGALPTTGYNRFYRMDSSNPGTTATDETGTDNGTLVNFNFDANSGWGAHT